MLLSIKYYSSSHEDDNIHHQSPLSIVDQEFLNLALDGRKAGGGGRQVIF